jgi:hypothetical protein
MLRHISLSDVVFNRVFCLVSFRISFRDWIPICGCACRGFLSRGAAQPGPTQLGPALVHAPLAPWPCPLAAVPWLRAPWSRSPCRVPAAAPSAGIQVDHQIT